MTTSTIHDAGRRTFALLAVTLLLGSGCGYNTLVQHAGGDRRAWAQVENQLQRRNDLIPNLVEVTKGYAKHEKEIFEAVANARAEADRRGLARADRSRPSNELSGALSRLLAIAEPIPT